MGKHYFAQDGNYGSAEGLVLVDTDQWTEQDFELIDESLDSERAEVARKIFAKYR